MCIIPTSAHGTNPASAVMAGMKVVSLETDNGKINLKNLRSTVEKYKDTLGAFMITYPSTCGIFEDTINEAIDIIH